MKLLIIFFTSLLLMASCTQVKQGQKTVTKSINKAVDAVPDKVVVKRGETAVYKKAISKPFYDVNLVKTKIPEELQNITSVYEVPKDCESAKVEIGILNEVLGEDALDHEGEDENGKKIDTLTLNIASLSKNFLSYNIPYSSVIRRISGASSREKKHLAALFRGQARRAYLNGYTHGNNCQN